jgi:uncharacterized membrane protein YdjX (TVP38/TMEM64 family)
MSANMCWDVSIWSCVGTWIGAIAGSLSAIAAFNIYRKFNKTNKIDAFNVIKNYFENKEYNGTIQFYIH